MERIPAHAATLDRVRLRDPVFISDLHLCAQRPQALARFHGLLEELAGTAAELLILGDLFEYWAGDDALAAADAEGAGGVAGGATVSAAGGTATSAAHGAADSAADSVGAGVAAALARLGRSGTTVYVMRGNRDVLLGEDFARASGARLLGDAVLAEFEPAGAPAPLLLAHGDAYCTLDLPYQAFRRQARDPRFQAAFLARPLAERRALIGEARQQSESGKQQMDAQIMDVTPDAIDAALRAAGVRAMIHGHTHRPARHDTLLDGQPALRWVLTDWEFDRAPARGGGLRRGAGGLETFALL